MPEDPKLPPELVDAFVAAVARASLRRTILIFGYLAALLALVASVVVALVIYANVKGRFAGWSFFLPPFTVGLVFWIFGRWAKKA